MGKNKEKSKYDHGVKPITSGTEQKKTALQKATDVLIKDDINTIKNSIVSDYIEPNSKKLVREVDRKFREFISDTINSAVSLILFGKTNNSSKKSSGYYHGQQVNYTTYYYDDDRRSNNNNDDKRREPANRVKRILISDYGTAEEVLRELNSYIEKYEYVSVGDYYQLVSMPTNQLDYNYGWHDIVFSKDWIVYDSSSGKYLIEFPKPVSLD